MEDSNLDLSYLVDGILSDVIEDVENQKYKTPLELTLLVNGFMICGKVISYDDWIKLMSPDSEGNSAPTESSKDLSVESQTEKNDAGESKETDDFRRFIHLKDAVIFHGVSRLPKEGSNLIRIKLSSVDGWMDATFELRTEKHEPLKLTVTAHGVKTE